MWLTERERGTMAALTVLVAGGLGWLAWQQRRVPIAIQAGPTPPYAQWDRAVRRAQTVDLNRASPEELERLPGIGPSLAARIAAHRQAHGPFASVADLDAVPGLGPKTIEQFRDYVVVNE